MFFSARVIEKMVGARAIKKYNFDDKNFAWEFIWWFKQK